MSNARVAVSFQPDEFERAAISSTLDASGGAAFLGDLDKDARSAALSSAEVLLTWHPERELGAAELARAEHIRLIQLTSAGADHISFGRLPPAAIVASNVGAYAVPVAEHALAMALAAAKRLPHNHARLAAGEFSWARTLRLRGGVAAILGLGGVGRACAHLFRCLGMRIHAINTSGRTDEAVDLVGSWRDLETVLSEADVTIVALPLTRASRGLIGASELALMKPEGILVNVARGAVLDEQALYEHLVTHPEFWACIDTWWNEPPRGDPFGSRHPFLDLPNVIGSPHNASLVPGIEAEAAAAAARNVVRFLLGEPIEGIQRPQDYE
jgi:glycerate dehydrogenase